MDKIRTFLFFAMLGLGGCATVDADRYGYSPVRPSCPEGTYRVCQEDSLRGCLCGQLTVLN